MHTMRQKNVAANLLDQTSIIWFRESSHLVRSRVITESNVPIYSEHLIEC
jgi:hypothetical protein